MGFFFLRSFPLLLDHQAHTKTSIIPVVTIKITICNQVTTGDPEYPALAVFLNLQPPFLEFFFNYFWITEKRKAAYKGNRK